MTHLYDEISEIINYIKPYDIVQHFVEEGNDKEEIELILHIYFNIEPHMLAYCGVRYGQAEFRDQIIKRDTVCVVTGFNAQECEAAHIVPYNKCRSYGINNGILLSRNVHKLFDDYLWSINPETCKLEIKDSIIGKNYSIEQYSGGIIKLDDITKKQMLYHHNMFLNKK
jgi:hypothetical protein